MPKKRKDLPVESTPPCKVVVFPLAGEKGTCVDCGMTWTREEHKAALRREEIDHLKAGWASDPCWDIEDAEGFEDVRAELIQFRQDMEFKWEEQRLTRIRRMAQEFGFVIENSDFYCVEHPTHVEPKRFVERMEKLLNHVAALEDRLEQAEIKLDRIGRGR